MLGDVSLGAEASVWYQCVLRADMAPITVGDRTNIQDLTVVHVDEDVPCAIGSDVGVGHRALLHGCVVEDNCLIGMGAIVLNHARVGAGSLVGAGALVTEGMRIPPDSLVLGVPGKVVRPVDRVLRERMRSTVEHYLELARRHRSGEFPVRTGL